MSKKIIALAAIALSLSIGGTAAYFYNWTEKAEASENAEEEMQQGPMPVQATLVKKETIQIWKEFPGRVTAVDFAEIRPQVSGNITAIEFKDGQMVEKNQILYVIDPRPYEADLEMAKALLSGAENTYSFAQKELKRAKDLIKTKAISERVLDERENAAKIAKAALDGAKAQLIEAEINMDHAYLKAPISGRVSRAEITVGNLVESGPNAPILTTIASSDGMYVDFEVDEQTYLEQFRVSPQNGNNEKSIPVRLKIGNDTTYEGFVHSFDNRIDPASGTIRARALFENKDQALLPGMFARLQIGSASTEEKILISERAIGTNQDRKFVYVIDENNMVTYRPIEIGQSILGQRVVKSGLNVGEKVISDGIIKIFPGMPVAPQISDPESNETSQLTQKK